MRMTSWTTSTAVKDSLHEKYTEVVLNNESILLYTMCFILLYVIILYIFITVYSAVL